MDKRLHHRERHGRDGIQQRDSLTCSRIRERIRGGWNRLHGSGREHAYVHAHEREHGEHHGERDDIRRGSVMVYTVTNDFPDLATVDKQSAAEGETVTVTMTTIPEGSGNSLLYVQNSDTNAYIVQGRVITLNTPTTFTMPAANVYVRVQRENTGGGGSND